MELVLLSNALSLVGGLAIGYFIHVLQTRRSERDRATERAVELWDRCSDIANARLRYIVAFHSGAANARDLRDAHRDVKGRHRWADPELVLVGVPEWEAYHDAERAALKERPLSRAQVKEIERLGYAVLDVIARRRVAVTKA